LEAYRDESFPGFPRKPYYLVLIRDQMGEIQAAEIDERGSSKELERSKMPRGKRRVQFAAATRLHTPQGATQEEGSRGECLLEPSAWG
jgi:hypothetical protein